MIRFEAIYFINLDYRTDRRDKFERNSKYLGVENLIRSRAVQSDEVELHNWPGSASELAIRLSHIKTLEDAKNRAYNFFIIFEDDTIIPRSFARDLSKLLRNTPSDWDMLYLYAENHFLKPIAVNDSVVKLQNTLGLVAVAYRNKSLDKIIEKLKSDLRWVDSVMADLHKDLNVYAPKESIVKHAFGYSDNLQKFIDYKNIFFLKVVVKILNFMNIRNQKNKRRNNN
ncbi:MULTISPECIES: hypothetical protein [unclassified Pedobacter]|uniref:hypothetical protein n=1 Tax=unclassified Pedobacter TaxID=2628915 RepID=UPI00142013A7|nr:MULTISPECIES: hypothetical protein [unclassified Pedobacter]NII81332.1 GR25 family glycosyltransferase involved in LPS biosynthesis [Pedobacter sp. SG908]NMN35338.1 GR25 family glycosyltransferase involved in LPS biosynthesis [Pedobacter sp. SG918]